MRYILLIASCFLSLSSFSQQDTTDLDPVTVTAGLSETAISKSGRNIIVLKGDRFQQLPVNSIDELLRYVPGIEIQSRGAMGAQSDIIIRGGTFQQVLVLLDGIRLNDPITGHFNSYVPISPTEIERIEILKGASSAIYGSDAVGGVIHVITKTFASKKGVVQKSALAQIAAGTYDLLNAQAGGYYGNGKTALGGGILTNNTNGQQQRGTKGYFNLHTASLSLSHFINEKFKVSYRSAYDDRKFSAQNFYTTFVSDTATERVKSFWNHLDISYQKGKSTVTADGGLKTSDDFFLFNKASVPNLNKSRLWQASLQNKLRITQQTTLVTGTQFFNRNINSNDRGIHSESQLAGFVILNHEALSGFSLSPALRLDWHQRRGAELIPQLALSYRLPQMQIRGSIGKTIRDADFTERYNNYNKKLVTSGRIGNPDLKAETSVSYEAGVDVFAAKGFRISGTFFQRFHKGLIDYVSTPYADMPRKENLSPTGNYALAQNIASVNILGAEADIHYTKTLNAKSNIQAGIGTVWLDVQNSEGASAFYISSFARYLVNFNLSSQISRFSIGATALYKERKAQTASAIKADLSKDYFVLNAKAEWMAVVNKLGIFMQADNIFDKQYSDLLGAQMPGRWLQGGIKYSFKK